MIAINNIKLPNLICLLGSLLLSSYSMAQQWPIVYGDNFHATISNIEETYDHGFLLSAYTYTSSGWPLYDWIIKIDINGSVLWEKRFGDGIYSNGVTNSKITQDNGIILATSTSKYSGDYDPTFIKLNVCGEVEWCRVFPSPDQNYGMDIIQLQDHSYVGLLKYYGEGPGYARISLVKMDPSGEPVWIQQQAQEDTLIYNEEGYHLIQTFDSNFLISGHCFYPGMRPFWIKTDTLGNQLWDLKGGGTGFADEVIQFNNDFFFSAGMKSGQNSFIPIIFKFDNSGTLLAQHFLLGDTLKGGGAKSIIAYGNNDLLIGIGWRTSLNVNEGFSEILHTDTLGWIINRRILIDENRTPQSICLSSDQKVVVVGNYVVDNNWDIYLWKMNADLEDDTLYTQPIVYDSLCPYQILSDTIDLDCDIFVNIEDIPTKEVYESTIKISPNPARDWALLTFPENLKNDRIYLTVYNTFGQAVIQKEIFITNNIYTLDTSGLPSGLYIILCRDKKKNAARGKFVVVR